MNEKDVQRMIYQNNMRNLYYDIHSVEERMKILKKKMKNNITDCFQTFLLDYLKENMKNFNIEYDNNTKGFSYFSVKINEKFEEMGGKIHNILYHISSYADYIDDFEICLTDEKKKNGFLAIFSIRFLKDFNFEYTLFYNFTKEHFKKYFNLGEDYEIQI